MYKAVQGFKNRTLNKVCMWRRLLFCPKKTGDTIEIDLDLDELDATSAELDVYKRQESGNIEERDNT